jgi:phage terminase Nu1 subunit (DNA packaging protein)
MPLINKTAFARMVKRSPREIRRLASEKRIKENGDGMIDTDDPLTVRYINTVIQPKEKKQKSEVQEKINSFASLEDQKLQADIQLKNEQALAVKTKRAQMLGLLIPRSMVDYKLSKLAEAISANLLTIPRRGTARSLAIIQAELEKQNIPFDVRQLKVHLELVWKELVSEALEKAKELEND